MCQNMTDICLLDGIRCDPWFFLLHHPHTQSFKVDAVCEWETRLTEDFGHLPRSHFGARRADLRMLTGSDAGLPNRDGVGCVE